MEIEFSNVTYKENVNTPLEQTFLRDINFKLIDNKVYSFVGDSKSGICKLGSLINMTAVPYKGIVRVGNYVNDGKYIRNINNLRMNVGYVKANPLDIQFNKTVKQELEFGLKYFKYKLNKKEIRTIDALKLVGLSESYLDKKISDLNIRERKLISIASTLIFNPNIIILEEVSLFLVSKDLDNIKRLIKKMVDKYDKTIILITKDTSLAYEVSDEVYMFNEGVIHSIGNSDLLTNEKKINECNLNVPGIIKFINVANKKGAKLTYTSNILDLIKEVYRNV